MADIVKRRGGQQGVAQRQPREWNPWDRMRELLEWDPFQELGRTFFPEIREGFTPAFEVRETKDAFIFNADLPGVREEDLEVHITGNRLTVSGRRDVEQRDETDRYYCYECSYGAFTRSFTLPDGVNAEDAKADLRHGVLTLHVPKRAEAQPRKISVGGATKHKA